MVKYLVFEVTGKCNLRCKYCYNSRYAEEEQLKTELTTDRIKSILSEAEESGFGLVAFSGGEPFLRGDLMELIRFSPLPVSVLTNGDMITKAQIEELSRIDNFKELRFSLDGFKAHDSVRENSDHKRIIDNIQFARSLDINVSINTMITSYNLSELQTLYDLIDSSLRGIMWRLDVPLIMGRYRSFEKELAVQEGLLFEELKKLISRYSAERPDFRMIIANIFKSNLEESGFYEHSMTEHPCDYALGSLTVRSNGDVSFCPSLSLIFGNVQSSSLADIMRSDKYLEFTRLKIKNIEGCIDCNYLRICGTGCRADAYEDTGSITGKDESACVHFARFEKHILPILSENLNEQFGALLND